MNKTTRVVIQDLAPVAVVTKDVNTLAVYGIITNLAWAVGVVIVSLNVSTEDLYEYDTVSLKKLLLEALTDDSYSNPRHLVAASLVAFLRSCLIRGHAPGFWPPMNDPGSQVLFGLPSIVLCRSLCATSGLPRGLSVSTIVMCVFIPTLVFVMLTSTSTCFSVETEEVVYRDPPGSLEPVTGEPSHSASVTHTFETYVWPGCRLMMSACVLVQGVGMWRAARILNSDEFVVKPRHHSYALYRLILVLLLWTIYSWLVFLSPVCKEAPRGNENSHIHMREQSEYTLIAARTTFSVAELVIATDFIWTSR